VWGVGFQYWIALLNGFWASFVAVKGLIKIRFGVLRDRTKNK